MRKLKHEKAKVKFLLKYFIIEKIFTIHLHSNSAIFLRNSLAGSKITEMLSNSPEIASNDPEIASNITEMPSNDPEMVSNTSEIASKVSEIPYNNTEMPSNISETASNDPEMAFNESEITFNSTEMIFNDTEFVKMNNKIPANTPIPSLSGTFAAPARQTPQSKGSKRAFQPFSAPSHLCHLMFCTFKNNIAVPNKGSTKIGV
jgi:hypothetical protein